jgi:hypothetical protein
MSRIASNPKHEQNILAEISQRDLFPELLEICNEHGVTPREVVGRSRLHAFVEARHHWWHHLYTTKTGWSGARIALLHGWETSSVQSGIRTHEGYRKKRP